MSCQLLCDLLSNKFTFSTDRRSGVWTKKQFFPAAVQVVAGFTAPSQSTRNNRLEYKKYFAEGPGSIVELGLFSSRPSRVSSLFNINSGVVKPKFHYADFHRNFPAGKVLDTNHESRRHDLCPRQSCRGLCRKVGVMEFGLKWGKQESNYPFPLNLRPPEKC